MPITAFYEQEPARHHNDELQALLDELFERTGVKWWVVTHKRTEKRFLFGSKEYNHTALMKDLGSHQVQLLTCVTTEGEAMAYVLGALGQLER